MNSALEPYTPFSIYESITLINSELSLTFTISIFSVVSSILMRTAALGLRSLYKAAVHSIVYYTNCYGCILLSELYILCNPYVISI